MKVTITYHCENCQTTFPAYCSVPDEMGNDTIGHACGGSSAFASSDGTSVSYMCGECGHITPADVAEMIPAMATKTHGCGEECRPA